MKLKLLFILCAATLACTNQDKENVFGGMTIRHVTFEKTLTAKGQVVNDINLFGCSDISIFDSLLVVTTPKLHTMYRIISLDTKTMTNIVLQGNAENELLRAFYPISYDTVCNQILMSIYDYINQTLVSLNLSKSISNNFAVFDTVNIKRISNINNLYRIYNMNDSIYFVDYLKISPISQNYATYDINNNVTDIPVSLNGGNISADRTYLLAAATTLNKQKNIYVGAMRYINQLNYLNIETPEQSFSISIDKGVSTFKDIPNKTDLDWYYTDIIGMDDCLIALYVNAENSFAEFHIFDWNGHAKTCIKTQEPLESIEIDKRNNTLYGITSEETLYTYDLSNIIN